MGDIGTSTAGHQAFVAVLAGTTWTAQVLDPPVGQHEGSLDGVSCPTVTVCLAVGATGSLSEGSRMRPDSYRLTGTTWTQLADPVLTSPSSSLTALSCVSVRTCVAIGRDSYNYPDRPTAQVFDGSVWHSMSLAPVDLQTSPTLRDISCATNSTCAAVGGYVDPSGVGQPLVEVLTNTTWRRAAVAADPATGGTLSSVSCVTGSRCTAVGSTGQYQDTSPNRPVSVTRAGDTWTGAVVDLPAGALSGVSCAGATTCVAVGDARGLPLAAALSGAGWTDAGAEAPAGFVGGEFDAVACSATNACTAGGWSSSADRQTSTPLVNRWNGATWKRQPLPALGDARITGLACPSASLCVAVGTLLGTGGRDQPLVLEWRSGAWHRVKIGSPGGTGAVLAAVSCSSTTSCLAVGQSGRYGGDPVAVALTGTTWSLTPTPPVGDLQYVTLGGVSCLSAGSCRVTGSGSDPSMFRSAGIDLLWDGSTFTSGPPVAPAGPLSCTGSGSCVALEGFSDDETSVSVLTGSTWTREALPDPSGTFTNVNGVACRGALSCVVVGSSFIARRTAGGTWAQQPVTPLAPGYLTLNAVACPSDTWCVAVGAVSGGPAIVVPPTG